MSEISNFNAKSLMLQGTSSHVGKSILVAALCRIFKKQGLRVAPFKAQNMALNSFVTKDGGEIGMAQAFQAEAAGIEPTVDINPILLKPTSDTGSQVIIHGKVYGNMRAQEYHLFKKEAVSYARESYRRLADEYEIIVIEGAGSPAEINLRENDIANMGMAEMADAPVILIGDIDRGGVFASIIGTMELLSHSERKRVRGFVINKFRGDIELLKPGIDFLENKTGMPVLGIVPYLKDIHLPDEDGVVLERNQRPEVRSQNKIEIAIIKLPRISNFTDFDPFRFEPDVALRYVAEPVNLSEADAILIPGSKNTLEDMVWLRKSGIADAITRYAKNGGRVAGICGGFQVLGRVVKDPHGVESEAGEEKGLGLLDAETVLEKEKKTYLVEATIQSGVGARKLGIKGYEIHMGETGGNNKPFAIIANRNGSPVKISDGAIADKGRIWGTYIHGIFDNDEFRAEFLNEIRIEKRLPVHGAVSFKNKKYMQMDILADAIKESVDIQQLYEIMGVIQK